MATVPFLCHSIFRLFSDELVSKRLLGRVSEEYHYQASSKHPKNIFHTSFGLSGIRFDLERPFIFFLKKL